jgi:photosystem II stability/assembly factor-like uncharacterized protein
MRTFQIFALILILSTIILAQNFWDQSNGPYGGDIFTAQYISEDSIIIGTRNGLYITSDMGDTWFHFDESLNFKSITDIEKYQDDLLIIPDHSALVLATGSSYDTLFFTSEHPATVAAKNNGKIFLGTSYNIYSSTDFGTSWISLEDSTMNINYSNKILIKNDTIIFYAEGNSIHRSYDDGESWGKINVSFSNTPVNTIYLDDEGNLYAANSIVKLVKSSDNGDTWENISNNVGSPIGSILKDLNDLYVGTSHGIFKSSNNGVSWFNYSNGIISGRISGFANCGGTIVATTFGNGLYVLNKNTNEWESKVEGIDATIISDMVIDSNDDVIVGIDGMGIYKGTGDDTFIWELKNDGLDNAFVNTLAISKNEYSYEYLYAGTDEGEYKSTNMGENWLSFNSPCYFITKGICVNDLGSIFSWTNCGVFRTTDDGISWELMNSNYWGSGEIFSIAADPNQRNVYVSAEYDFFRTTDNGDSWTNLGYTGGYAVRIGINCKGVIYVLRRSGEILRSTNFGNSFQTINNNLPIEYTFLKDIDFNSDDEIYLATKNGLYVSANDGNDWYLMDESNVSKNINLLNFDSEDRLYAGSTVSGVYRSIDLLVNIIDDYITATKYFLSQNYPNPFNPLTKIKYQIPEFSYVTIKVYDVLGNEIATLINEEKPAGSYEVEFSVGRDSSPDIATGIYFYRINAGAFVETKKMILLK